MEEETQNTQVPAHRFSAFHFLFSALPFNRRRRGISTDPDNKKITNPIFNQLRLKWLPNQSRPEPDDLENRTLCGVIRKGPIPESGAPPFC